MHHPSTALHLEARPATAKYDIAIACRVCSIPSNSKPPIFAEDKLKLVEFCLKSLKASLGNLRAKMWVVLTGPPEYEQMFEKVWPKEDLVVVNVGRIGNPRSLRKQIDILTTQTDAELVFLAEDDYFYLPDKFQSAVEFLRSSPDTSFISPYDHPDNYVIPFQQSLPPAAARKCGGLSWYARATTTHTFLTRKTTLQKCQKLFRASFFGGYKIWGSQTDTMHWLALTKTKIFNLPLFLKSLVKYHYWAACMVLAWIFRWRQILFGERYTLWIPSPSIATHMTAGLEAPGVDWQKEFGQCLSKV
ncbi:MAG: hypothetical protein ABSG80_04215 [Verrucomicrobiota bacterium]|jgi:hypothetical protein